MREETVNEQMIKATRAYLEDWADDGHSIIPANDLIKYGFSGPWLRDLAERYPSEGGKWDITVGGNLVDSFTGVWSLALLETLLREFHVGSAELAAAAKTVGCSPTPIGRGTSARLYTVALRTALSRI